MASGTINGSTANQYIDAKIVWSSSADVLLCKSIVTASLYYKRNSPGYLTTGTGSFSITINGKKTSVTAEITIVANAWVKAMEASVEVNHNSDGKKSIEISASGSIEHTSLSSTYVNGTATLDTILCPSTLDSFFCETKYWNGTITYRYTPKNVNHFHQCVMTLNKDGELFEIKRMSLGKKPISGQTETITFSDEELSEVYTALPDSASGTLRLTLFTYSDAAYETQVGEESYREITLEIPNTDDTKPYADMTLSPVSALPFPFANVYIEGKTKVEASFDCADGRYGASVVSYELKVSGKCYGLPYRSDYLTDVGDLTVTGTVTDSRGFSRTYTETISVLPYTPPRITGIGSENDIVCARCDGDGTLSDAGTHLLIKAKRIYSKLFFHGIQNNFCVLRYRYKITGGSYSNWKTILSADRNTDEVVTGALTGGALSVHSSYIVQIQALDDIGETDTVTISLPHEKVYMHRAGSIRSLGIGECAEEENTLSVASDIITKFRGKVLFEKEVFEELGLSDAVSDSSANVGRSGVTGYGGCFYRISADENHIEVAFNCAFSVGGSEVRVNADLIPEAYRPKSNVYALCPTSGGIGRIHVNPYGEIFVDTVYSPTSSSVTWIDGFLDYRIS